jgi:hypothetical protein
MLRASALCGLEAGMPRAPGSPAMVALKGALGRGLFKAEISFRQKAIPWCSPRAGSAMRAKRECGKLGSVLIAWRARCLPVDGHRDHARMAT